MNDFSDQHTTPAVPTIRPPRRFRRLIERVCARDRDHFDRRPAAVTHLRAYVPGEFWPLRCPDATVTAVRRLPLGCQTRQPGVLRDGGFQPVGGLAVFDDSDARGAAGPPDTLPGGVPLLELDCRDGGAP